MAIHPSQLLHYPIPEIHEHYGPRDCALYALSLGLGQDPLDERALAFVGGDDRIKPFPTMPLVLADPGFWMARPDTGIDARKVVLSSQNLTILNPLQATDTVISRSRVSELVDQGTRRGARAHIERLLTSASGIPLARMQTVVVLRGDGGFGGSAMQSSGEAVPATPRTPPDWQLEMTTRPEQALYYRWNGDDNPLHRSPSAAREAGFERPILHGLCTFGMAARAVLQTALDWEADRLHTLGGRFTRPVFPGDVLRAQIWREGRFQVMRPADGKVVLDRGAFSTRSA